MKTAGDVLIDVIIICAVVWVGAIIWEVIETKGKEWKAQWNHETKKEKLSKQGRRLIK